MQNGLVNLLSNMLFSFEIFLGGMVFLRFKQGLFLLGF